MNSDVPRYIEFYEKQFKLGSLKKTKKYTNTKDKVNMLDEYSGEEEEAKEKMDDLCKQILRKKKPNGNNLLSNLGKYHFNISIITYLS